MSAAHQDHSPVPTFGFPLSVNSRGLRGRFLPTSWDIPDDLSEDEWIAAGTTLGKVERSVSWWIGDWWIYGELKFRGIKAIVECDGWKGPSYGTCRNIAVVCRSVPKSRRRDTVSFKHFTEVASLPPKRRMTFSIGLRNVFRRQEVHGQPQRSAERSTAAVSPLASNHQTKPARLKTYKRSSIRAGGSPASMLTHPGCMTTKERGLQPGITTTVSQLTNSANYRSAI